jgi:hypothetical protein
MFSNVLLDFHSSSDAAYRNLARHLAALRKAINSLDKYEPQARGPINFNPAGDSRHLSPDAVEFNFPFPYPNSFVPYGPGDNRAIYFTYVGKVEGRRFLFRGKLRDDDDDRHICIKFVQAYGTDVHMWCADQGFAPKLIALTKLPGGWSMVVMDFLDQSWVPITEMKGRPDALCTAVHTAVAELHKNDMVHGDLRDTNLLVKQGQGGESKFMLVDFDWAGYQRVVTYPRHLNTSTLRRPKEAVDGAPILADHDIFMLQHLFPNARTRPAGEDVHV